VRRFKNTAVPDTLVSDSTDFTHASLLELAENLTEDSHLTGVFDLVLAMPYFDLVHNIHIPIGHKLLHGVCDDLLDVILPSTAKNLPYTITTKSARELLERRVKGVQTVEDASRPLPRLTTARGFWTIDDTAWFFGLYLPLLGIYEFIEAPWMNSCVYNCIRLVYHFWFLYHPGSTFKESQAAAQTHADALGFTLEREKIYEMCSSNMHSIIRHGVRSEYRANAIAYRKEFGLERKIGSMKDNTDHVTAIPEKKQARDYAIAQKVASKEVEVMRRLGRLPETSLTGT